MTWESEMNENKQHRLVAMEGPDQGRAYPLQGMICTLGRASDNTLVVDSPRVSRHHAQIRLLPSGAVIEDMGSTNGTWVNQRRLRGPHQLSSGDAISLADFISFRYEVEGEMRTEQVEGADRGRSTQVMGDDLPVPDDYAEAHDYPTPEPETGSDDVVFTPAYEPVTPGGTAPQVGEPVEARDRRPTWVYILIGILVLVIFACVAFAVYLWFAPLEFWEWVFDLFGVPMPTEGMLLWMKGALVIFS
jgi:pSer/pThr/pTyr-binding forkhead associated (FHA) protein